jgi:hypothetical protein
MTAVDAAIHVHLANPHYVCHVNHPPPIDHLLSIQPHPIHPIPFPSHIQPKLASYPEPNQNDVEKATWGKFSTSNSNSPKLFNRRRQMHYLQLQDERLSARKQRDRPGFSVMPCLFAQNNQSIGQFNQSISHI